MSFKKYECLSEMENIVISQLDYFAQDEFEDVNYTFDNVEEKILAIAIYDWWHGANLQMDIFTTHLAKGVFNKLFNCEVSGLF